MEDENKEAQKKFQIIEQTHRQNPNAKVYKIHIVIASNILKTQQKLKAKFQQNSSSQNITLPPNITNLNYSNNNDLIDDFQDIQDNTQNHHQPLQQQSQQSSQQPSQQQNPQRSSTSQKPVKIFQDFKNRGKFDVLKFFYSKKKQRITLLISQNHFINQLKYRQMELLYVVHQFTKIWQEQYLNVMQAFMKYAKQFNHSGIIMFQFVAIDILGVTFDVSYNNKIHDKIQQLKRFRFRYSPFQFRQNPFFQDKNTQQTMSFIEVHSGNIGTMTHNDFYTSMRLGFIDDINNNSNDLWKRVIMRFWVFYQLHCLNRGINDSEEFNKKALGRVHFHSIRMKKFQLIFPFPLLHRSIIHERKEGTLYFTFYIQDKQINMNESGLQFKMSVNLVQHYGILSHEQKQQLFRRLRAEQYFKLKQKQIPPKSNELFEFEMILRFDQKITKAFARFSTVVSFFIDKLSFNELRPLLVTHQLRAMVQQSDEERIIQICSKPVIYKQSQFVHTHQLSLQLKHKYQVPKNYQNQTQTKYVDEIQIYKLWKKKIKKNQKQEKQVGNQKNQIMINDDLKRYISHVLKTKPLRECYNLIMEYIQNVVKVIYSPFKDTNSLVKYELKQSILSMIVTNIFKFLDLNSHPLRSTEISIITEDSPLFIRQHNQKNLIAEITLNINDLKIFWVKRLPEGYIIIRMFDDKIQVFKDLSIHTSFKINHQNLENSSELTLVLKNILMKQLNSLQSMMV